LRCSQPQKSPKVSAEQCIAGCKGGANQIRLLLIEILLSVDVKKITCILNARCLQVITKILQFAESNGMKNSEIGDALQVQRVAAQGRVFVKVSAKQ
jgi:hypothetical protein